MRFFLKRNIITLFLLIIILINANCKNNNIIFSIKSQEVEIKIFNKSESINFNDDAKNIFKKFTTIKSHEIPGGDFYTLQPYPIECALPWNSDKIAYIIIYFENESISKYSNKYDVVGLNIKFKDKILNFNNKMNIDDIKSIFGKNNIDYMNVSSNLMEINLDNLIKIFFDMKTNKIYNFQIHFRDIKKKKEPVAINIIKYTPKTDNLRFRETPNLDGKFIRLFVKGEKLELLETGKAEVINGVKGTWVKVKTEKGEVGWCFDAYLEEVK